MKAKKLILSLIGGAILMAAYLAYFHASNQSYLSSFIVYICLFLIAGQGWNLLGGYIVWTCCIFWYRGLCGCPSGRL